MSVRPEIDQMHRNYVNETFKRVACFQMCLALVQVEQARSRASPVWCQEAKYPVRFICEIAAALIWIYARFTVGRQLCEVFQRLYVWCFGFFFALFFFGGSAETGQVT